MNPDLTERNNKQQRLAKQRKEKQQRKSIKSKVGSLKRLTELTNLQLGRLRKIEGRLKLLLKSEMKVGTLLPILKKYKSIIKNYYKQLYANKLNNLDEMDNFQNSKTKQDNVNKKSE